MPRAPDESADAERLLDVVRRLVTETRAGDHGRVVVSLDSRLDRDLSLDSLARAELALRLEREFDARLPEALVSAAETPRDLLQAIAARVGRTAGEAAPRGASVARERMPETADVGAPPETCATLPEVLAWHVVTHPNRTHITLLADGEREVPITYADLARGAATVAAGLRRFDVAPGQAIGLMLPTCEDFFFAFFGALLAGAVPVPMYPPARWDRIEDHLRRQVGILESCGARLLLTVEQAVPLARLLPGTAPELREILTVAQLVRQASAEEAAGGALRSPDDIAFLQYTSGSTGNPKGVIVTHANLLANLRAIGRVFEPLPGEVFVSWLPLYHDMGLIGAWFGSLLFGVHLVIMPPTAFLSRPSRWLTTVSRWRANFTAAPNFAWEICASKVDDRDLEGVDLSSLRWVANGAEAVDPGTVERVLARFERYGLKRGAYAPVYGLAEAAVGLTFPPTGRGPRVDRVDRVRLARDGIAAPARPDDPGAARFVAGGYPLPDHEIRVVAPGGRELPERTEGRIEFRGPSATPGYYRNAEATRALFRDGWLDTGDLGYVADGELFVTARVKDMIKRGGHNVHPAELEEAVGLLPGVRRGCVAVVGVPDAASGSERVVVIAEVRDRRTVDERRLRSEINRLADALIGGPADEVVLAPPHTVLKTSSGKIRRAATRELYLRGGERRLPVGWQVARLAASALHGRARRAVRGAIALAWSTYAWALVAVVGAAAIAAAVMLPGFRLRNATVRALDRALLALSGLPLSVRRRELAQGTSPRIVVANHASYVDAFVLLAVLPPHCVFVAKREFDGTALGWLIRRCVPVRFVERFVRERALEDAREVEELAAAGTSLVYFPEGTFGRAPGLFPFRMGAFVAAARASVPILPVTLQGTRDVLRADSWVPRRVPVTITFEEPIAAESADWTGAVALRDRTREVIEARLRASV